MTHTPTPWFVAGVRQKMANQEWHGINQYDEAKKQDINIACVGYNPRTDEGRADAHFIVKAVNAHDDLVAVLKYVLEWGMAGEEGCGSGYEAIRAALAKAGAL